MHEFTVWINTVAPTVTLARDCAVQAATLACNNSPTTAGTESILLGGVSRFTTLDRLEVRIDWGDGTGSFQQAGEGGIQLEASPISLEPKPGDELDLDYLLRATHTYTEPGYYTVTVGARNQAGASQATSTVLAIKGQQQLSFEPAGRPALRRRAGRRRHRQRLRPARHLHGGTRRRLPGRRAVRLADHLGRRRRVHRHRPPGRRQRHLDRRRPGDAHLRGAAGAVEDHGRRRVQDLRRPRP